MKKILMFLSMVLVFNTTSCIEVVNVRLRVSSISSTQVSTANIDLDGSALENKEINGLRNVKLPWSYEFESEVGKIVIIRACCDSIMAEIHKNGHIIALDTGYSVYLREIL